MNALKADPRTIDLRSLAPHFYNLSERILELFEEEEMVDILTDVSRSSGNWIMSNRPVRHSRNAPQRSLTMRITRKARWARGSSSYRV